MTEINLQFFLDIKRQLAIVDISIFIYSGLTQVSQNSGGA